MNAEDVISSGDKVVACVRATGTHQGEFMGIPATSRELSGLALPRRECVEPPVLGIDERQRVA
jgi:hypothetical protein